jgi:hypothetical protein
MNMMLFETWRVMSLIGPQVSPQRAGACRPTFVLIVRVVRSLVVSALRST